MGGAGRAEVIDIVDEVASGALSAADRKPGQLIDRCESGELDGIIVRFEDRFARDVVAGGGRAGEDELNSQSQLVFSLMMAVGQAQRERNSTTRFTRNPSPDLVVPELSCAPWGYAGVDRGGAQR